jgi:hypothetical protein
MYALRRDLRCLSLTFLSATTLLAQVDLSQRAELIGNLLKSGQFEKAEPLVRECLREVPHEIPFLSQLEMSLNGQGKYAEADQVAARVRQIWKSEYKEQWIANGSPVAEASWARIMITSRNYYVIGTEYFLSHQVEGDPTAKDKASNLMVDYKLIALPKRKGNVSRIFMLDKTASEKRYFLEEFSAGQITMVATYGNEKPDIRTLTKVVADYLDKSRTDGP